MKYLEEDLPEIMQIIKSLLHDQLYEMFDKLTLFGKICAVLFNYSFMAVLVLLLASIWLFWVCVMDVLSMIFFKKEYR